MAAAPGAQKFVVESPQGAPSPSRQISRDPRYFWLAVYRHYTRSQHPSVGPPRNVLPHKLYCFIRIGIWIDAAFMEEFEDMTALNPKFHSYSNGLNGDVELWAWPYEKGPHQSRNAHTSYSRAERNRSTTLLVRREWFTAMSEDAERIGCERWTI